MAHYKETVGLKPVYFFLLVTHCFKHRGRLFLRMFVIIFKAQFSIDNHIINVKAWILI